MGARRMIRSHHTEESATGKVAKRLARTAAGRAILASPDYQILERSQTGDELADALPTITDRERRGVLLRAYFVGEVEKKPRAARARPPDGLRARAEAAAKLGSFHVPLPQAALAVLALRFLVARSSLSRIYESHNPA
jgi:hypothetical protein